MRWNKYLILWIIILIACTTTVFGNDIKEKEAIDQLEFAKSLYLNGDYNHSFEVIEPLTLNYPDNTSAWNLKGLIFLKNGSNTLAIDSFQHALNNSPYDPRILSNLGLTSMNQGDLKAADHYFNLSLAGNPQDIDAHFYLGLVKYQLGQYDESIDLFKYVTTYQSGDTNAWFNLGMAYEKIQRLDLAIRAYDRASEIDPEYAKPLFSKGRIYTILGNTSLAINQFENYTQLEPNDSEGWFWYSTNLKKTNMVNESIAALNKAIALNPENQEYPRYLSMYNGEYNNTIAEYLLTPLSPVWVGRIFGLLTILLLISVMRYKFEK